MKKILALSFFLVTPLLGQDATGASAHDILENSDISDGTTHWHGNAKLADKGITVDLRPASWAEVTQEIHGFKVRFSGRALVVPPLKLTVVYQTSPDFSLSTKETDYVDIGPGLGFDKTKIKGQPGQIMAFVDYPATTVRGTTVIDTQRPAAAFIIPKTDQQPQTFTGTLTFPGGQRTINLTFCLAFPPGTGSVTVTKISLTELPVPPPH